MIWEVSVSYTHLGITKGSKQNSIEIAKKMLEKNKEISEIIEFTGLTKEEIESLK